VLLVGKLKISYRFLLLHVFTTTQCEDAMGQNEWCAIVNVMSTNMHVVMLVGLIPKILFLECTSFVAIYSSLCLFCFFMS